MGEPEAALSSGFERVGDPSALTELGLWVWQASASAQMVASTQKRSVIIAMIRRWQLTNQSRDLPRATPGSRGF